MADRDEKVIRQLEKRLGTGPIFLLKFCNCKRYAEDVCEGKLYANTIDYFRKIEWKVLKFPGTLRNQSTNGIVILDKKYEKI